MNNEWDIRRQLVEVAKRVYDRGYVAASDGNVSHRLPGDRVLVTPSGSCLGELQPNDLVCVSCSGRTFGGGGKPTSELPLHLAVYELRPDVNAVVHAHPPIANAFSFAGQSLDQCVIPEVVQGIGTIPTTEYATPSSDEAPRVVRDLIGRHDVILLQRHGSLTVGPTLRDAYFKLDKLEHAARMLLAARQLGAVIPLSSDELRRLGEVRERQGIGTSAELFEICARCER
jgi:L-fuculose-phosphate aldolase